jgi:hypothetical protein
MEKRTALGLRKPGRPPKGLLQEEWKTKAMQESINKHLPKGGRK